MQRAVLYLRLSSSAEDSTSIARQAADLQQLADREGWTIARTLTDDGISGRKARANAAEALRMLRDDEADVLAVWKLDRWTRQGLGAIGALSEALDAVPSATFVALQDGLRSDQPAWRLIAAVLSEVARTEADNTAKRVASSISHRRTVADRYTGGATVPFGYQSAPAPDGVGRVLVPHPEEARVIRDVAERFLTKTVSQTRVAMDLTEARVPTSRSPRRAQRNRTGVDDEALSSGYWRTHSVREIWTSDNLLGRVTHRGQLVRDEHGLPRAVWEPLLDRATVERLRVRLASVPRTLPNRPKAARLLSGLAHCGHCGRRMYVSTSGGRPVYRCATPREYGECTGFPRVDAVHLERLVAGEYLLYRGSYPELRETQVVHADDRASDLQDVEASLREATAALAEDDADPAALFARIGALKERRTELRALPSAEIATELVPTGLTLAEAWHATEDVEERREQLSRRLDHVAVSAATDPNRRSRAIDPNRVELRWHFDPDEYADD